MMDDKRALHLAMAVFAIAVVAGADALVPGPGARAFAAASQAEKLPDLDQAAPKALTIAGYPNGAKKLYRLGFDSAVQNIGDGPLVVVGHRTADQSMMQADQIVVLANGSTKTYGSIAKLQYVVAKKLNGQLDHQHWHYLGFDHFEIRNAKTYKRVRRDRKQGFCLGDRYAIKGASLPRNHAPPFTPSPDDRCGLTRPDLLTVTEGISVGFGDNYTSHVEGQEIDITGIGAGRYNLVHRVNADRKIRETRYTNDASSVLVKIYYPNGRNHGPQIRVLKTCSNSKRCPAR
jgi:hypothetical protein